MKKIALFFIALSFMGCKNDPSYSTTEAINLGAPNIESTWTFDDFDAYKKFIFKISSDTYPRASSKKSKDLFWKFIEEYKSFDLLNQSIDINERLRASLSMVPINTEILEKYLKAHNNDRIDYSEELVHLQGIMLSIVKKSILLVEEFLPTIDKDDGKYDARMDGLKKMKSGHEIILRGLYLGLTETETYSDAERMELVKYLSADGPFILKKLDSNIIENHKIEIEKLILNEKKSEIKIRLKKILDKIY